MSEQVEEIELTIDDLMKMEEALGTLVKLRLPSKTSYRLSRLLNKLMPEYTLLHQKRQELLEKYGEKMRADDPELEGLPNLPGQIQFKLTEPDLFYKEFNQLLTEKIKLSWIPLRIEDFGDCNEISPSQFVQIEKLMVHEEM